MTAQILPYTEAGFSAQAEIIINYLTEGKLVVLPTETIYGIAANLAHPEAIERLSRLKQRTPDHPFTIVTDSIKHMRTVTDCWSKLMDRIARRTCPGPVTLILPARKDLFNNIDEKSRSSVLSTGSLGMRIPDHPITLEVLKQAPFPIVLTSANHHGDPENYESAGVIASLSDDVDVILDAGPTKYQTASTVIAFKDDYCVIKRQGVISAEKLQKLTAQRILFICTGNTCRSPMAQAFFSREIAHHFRCGVNNLPKHGWIISSCGINARKDDPISFYALETMRKFNINLPEQKAKEITGTRIRGADYIFVMTEQQLHLLQQRFPSARNRIQLLSPEGHDIADPFGGSMEDYMVCALEIEKAAQKRAADIESENLKNL